MAPPPAAAKARRPQPPRHSPHSRHSRLRLIDAQPLDLPREIAGLPRLGFFPGSTIGNMEPDAAVDLLRAMRRLLGEDAMLLIGMDRIKDRDRLIAAYDDPEAAHPPRAAFLSARDVSDYDHLSRHGEWGGEEEEG